MHSVILTKYQIFKYVNQLQAKLKTNSELRTMNGAAVCTHYRLNYFFCHTILLIVWRNFQLWCFEIIFWMVNNSFFLFILFLWIVLENKIESSIFRLQQIETRNINQYYGTQYAYVFILKNFQTENCIMTSTITMVVINIVI